MSYQRNILTRIPVLFVDEATKLRQDTPGLSVVVYKAKETVASAGVVEGQFYWVSETGTHNLLSTGSTTNLSANTISEATSGNGVAVDGVSLKDGGVGANSMFAGFFPITAQNNIAAAAGGAIAVTNYLTTINTDAGGDAFTLANGAQIGQLKKILLVVDGGGDAVITPVSLTGGTTITMNDAADYVILIWTGTAWVAIENSGSTIA